MSGCSCDLCVVVVLGLTGMPPDFLTLGKETEGEEWQAFLCSVGIRGGVPILVPVALAGRRHVTCTVPFAESFKSSCFPGSVARPRVSS